MAHLRTHLNRDIAPYRVPLIVNLLILEKDRRLMGGFTNIRRLPSGQASVMSKFEYVMNELDDWAIFANGSGGTRLVSDGHLVRLQPHLKVIPRKPMNHMKLLAIINRQVANKEMTVSPFCHVSFINSDDRFEPASHTFTGTGEAVPFEMPVLLSGIDLTDLIRDFHRNSQAFLKGEIPALPEVDTDKMNQSLKRRP